MLNDEESFVIRAAQLRVNERHQFILGAPASGAELDETLRYLACLRHGLSPPLDRRHILLQARLHAWNDFHRDRGDNSESYLLPYWFLC